MKYVFYSNQTYMYIPLNQRYFTFTHLFILLYQINIPLNQTYISLNSIETLIQKFGIKCNFIESHKGPIEANVYFQNDTIESLLIKLIVLKKIF